MAEHRVAGSCGCRGGGCDGKTSRVSEDRHGGGIEGTWEDHLILEERGVPAGVRGA